MRPRHAGEPCKGGHPYRPMRDKRGWLRCWTCHNARSAKVAARERLDRVARFGTGDLRTLRKKPWTPKMCPVCGSAFGAKPERISEFLGQIHCSLRCAARARSRPETRQRRPPVVTGHCDLCGESASSGRNRCRRCYLAAVRHRCEVCGRETPRRFCSRRCAVAHSPRRRQSHRCRECKETFLAFPSSRRIFCSDACFRAFFARKAKVADVVCAQCGRAFRRRLEFIRRVRRVFCSQECAWRFNSGRQSPMSREGIRDRKRGSGWLRLAETVRKRDAHTCQRCGKTQAENRRRLCVDHIIPWRLFPEDDKHAANDPKNLVSLCTACHSWKTAHAEQRWLRGDVLDFKAFERSIALPSLVPGGQA